MKFDNKTTSISILFLLLFLLTVLLVGGTSLAYFGKTLLKNNGKLSENLIIFKQNNLLGIAVKTKKTVTSTNKSNEYFRILYSPRYKKIVPLKHEGITTHFLGFINNKIDILPNSSNLQPPDKIYSCDKILSYDLKNKLMYIIDDGVKWLADNQGKKIVCYNFNIKRLTSNLYQVDDKYALITPNNQNEFFDEIKSPFFDSTTGKINHRSGGKLLAVRKKNTWGLISLYGLKIVPFEASSYKYYQTKERIYWFFQKKNKWGLAGGPSKEIEYKYDNIDLLSSKINLTFFKFQRANKFGLISNMGYELFEFENFSTRELAEINGLVVNSRNKNSVYSHNGSKIIETSKNILNYLGNSNGSGIFLLEENGKKHLYNDKHKQIYSLEIDNIYPLKDALRQYIVEINQKKGLIDIYGREIIPPSYDSINIDLQKRETILSSGKLIFKFGLLPENISPIKHHKLPFPIHLEIFDYALSKTFREYSDYIAYPITKINGSFYTDQAIIANENIFTKYKIWAGKWHKCNAYLYKINKFYKLPHNELAEKIKGTNPNKSIVYLHEDMSIPIDVDGQKIKIGISENGENTDFLRNIIKLQNIKMFKAGFNHILIIEKIK